MELRPTRLLAALAGAVLVLTGCGGGDDTTAADESPGSEATATGNPFGSDTAKASEAPTVVVTETVTAAPDGQSPASTSPATARPALSEGDGAAGGDGPPASVAQIKARLTAAGAPIGASTFTTPSGNIYCSLTGGVLPSACEIGEGSISDPEACSGTMVPNVGRLEFDLAGRVQTVCNSDTIVTPGARTVPYGTAVQGPGVVCLVEDVGVSCLSDLGQAFTLRKGAYRVFR